MVRARRRNGFTLIEVLIVVVIMSVLAATIIPQFSNSAKDARESSIKFNVHQMRAQINMYRMQHNGTAPTGLNNLEQLTKSTNVTGTVGATGTSFPYGPYIQTQLPAQPFSGLNTVKIDSGTGVPAATAGNGGGWIYRPSTGEIWVDHLDYVSNPNF